MTELKERKKKKKKKRTKNPSQNPLAGSDQKDTMFSTHLLIDVWLLAYAWNQNVILGQKPDKFCRTTLKRGLGGRADSFSDLILNRPRLGCLEINTPPKEKRANEARRVE